MTPYEVEQHNENCDDDETIWCECAEPVRRLGCCAKCGGAVPGIVILESAILNQGSEE